MRNLKRQFPEIDANMEISGDVKVGAGWGRLGLPDLYVPIEFAKLRLSSAETNASEIHQTTLLLLNLSTSEVAFRNYMHSTYLRSIY
jgi:hypothetical protein